MVYGGVEIIPSLHDTIQNTFFDYKDNAKVNGIIEEMKLQGGQKQLIMFLSGPARAVKSSVIKVVR